MKKKLAIAGLAVGLTAFVLPSAAHAASTDVTKGGCSFNTVQQDQVGQAYTGEIDDESVTTTAANTPIAAEVHCWIDVNGSQATPTAVFGDKTSATSVAQAGADQVSYVAQPTDIVTLCQQTFYADGTSSDVVCPTATSLQIPPQAVLDALQTVIDTINGVLSGSVDPLVCPILKANAGTYGPVVINSDGDVFLSPDPLGLGELYTCPPYDV